MPKPQRKNVNDTSILES